MLRLAGKRYFLKGKKLRQRMHGGKIFGSVCTRKARLAQNRDTDRPAEKKPRKPSAVGLQDRLESRKGYLYLKYGLLRLALFVALL